MILLLRLIVLCVVTSWLQLGVEVVCMRMVPSWLWLGVKVACMRMVPSWLQLGVKVVCMCMVPSWLRLGVEVVCMCMVPSWLQLGVEVVCMCMVPSWLQFGVEADCIVYGYQLVRAWCWGWPVSVLAVTFGGRGSAPTNYQLVTASCWNWPVSAVVPGAGGPAPAGYSFVLKLTYFICRTRFWRACTSWLQLCVEIDLFQVSHLVLEGLHQLVTALCWNWPVSAVTFGAGGPAPAGYSFVLKLTCFSCRPQCWRVCTSWLGRYSSSTTQQVWRCTKG